jgi:3-hydroxyisobutyrate dehydrogenase/2-hydroxy-3-oxopropionate reductase
VSALSVGLAGLGRMGRPMARNLARAGLLVGVYNRTRSIADALAEETGVASCATPAELAELADVLITMVVDEDASMRLYAGPDGFLETLRPSTVCVEMSTVSIDHVHALGRRVEDAGGALVDAPVSGSVSMAESATLTLMAGGPEASLARIDPALRVLGSTIFHLGPLGQGAAMKLAVNTVVYGLNEALSEGLVLAERSGIPRLLAYDVFAQSAVAAPFVHYRRKAFEFPDDAPVTMLLPTAGKDLELILKLAEDQGQTLPQAELNAGILAAAVEAGYAEADISAVAQYLRQRAADGVGGQAPTT